MANLADTNVGFAAEQAPGRSDSEDKFLRARRHSRAVQVLKVALPVIAAVLALGFIVYFYVVTPGPVATGMDGAAYSEGKLVMANPKLEGFTREGRPYKMTAVRAVQALGQQSVVELEEIDATLPLDAETVATVDAARGVYDRDKNTLDISTEVTMTTTGGMSATLQSAFLDIAKGVMRTSEPVNITTNGSTITSDSMSVLDNGKVLVFEKRVRVHLDPAQMKSRQQASGDPDAAP